MPAVALDIEFPLHTVGALTDVQSAVLRQAEYAHELLIVETRQQISDLRTNTPVQATLGSIGDSIDFVGYVHHVRDAMSKHDGDRRQVVVCIGATWRMKQQRQRVWQDMTASEIALAILGEYQLTADVQPTTKRLGHKVQTTSDWAFLCTLAKSIGFVVYPRGTIVHFHERKHVEDQKVASSPVFTYRREGSGFADTEVTEFRPLLGEDMPNAEGSKAARAVSGVDPRTAQVIRASHDGRPDSTRRTDNTGALFEHAHTDTVVNTIEDAETRAQAASDVAMWQHRADAETVGNVTVAPTGFVYMDDVPGHFEGFWAVIAVEHRFIGNRYRLQMSLGTDSLGSNVGGYVPPAAPFVNGQQVATERRKQTVSTLSVPGNFDSIALKRTAGGPVPLTWRGSAAVVHTSVLAQTQKDSPATLVAKARRFRNSGG